MPVLQGRQAGILLPISALPSGPGTGDFDDAKPFIDCLNAAGVGVWQVLPLGPTHEDRSPYLCLSAHAGNANCIGLRWLVERKLLADLPVVDDGESPFDYRRRCLQLAFNNFQADTHHPLKTHFQTFTLQHEYWLRDFSLFIALRKRHNNLPWDSWPASWRDYHEEHCPGESFLQKNFLDTELQQQVEQVRFEQFLFFTQWWEIKAYAHDKGVTLFGDLPLFVAYDSADVWANRQYFLLEADGQAKVVAGVPPDYFSATGQRWGNPHYNWDTMAADGFQWWVKRARANHELFDLIRIDHFRGLESVWEIPHDAQTAEQGHWRKVPGADVLQALYRALPDLRLVAEDLGYITPEVHALRERFKLPGMAVLQFAFDSDDNNPYLPGNLHENSVIYTGTHDNNTTLGWFNNLTLEQKQNLKRYFGNAPIDMPWSLIEMAFSSIAQLAVIPMQDVLGLDGEHRMNTPGTTENNWRWRFRWKDLTEAVKERLRRLIEESGRIKKSRVANL